MKGFRIQTAFGLLLACVLSSCHLDLIGLKLAPGWQARSLIVYRRAEHPDMIVTSRDGRYLFVSCETRGGGINPSLIRMDLKNNHRAILIKGLIRADGLKLGPDGSLWLGEEFANGLIWRIAEPEHLIPEQEISRPDMNPDDPAIATLPVAGRFSHEGIAFSYDGRYAYMADEWEKGCLYRLDIRLMKLAVLNESGAWVTITNPMEARQQAQLLHGRRFNRIEDMETLPDHRILMSETGTGRILALDDRDGSTPRISEYLHNSRLYHPDNLAWDSKRNWLWITDDDKPSILWAWDGSRLMRIASHNKAEITGVLAAGDNIYINLQNRSNGPELTMRLYEKP
ncbi:MAG TPA: hypothetical protein VJ961_08440 [Mariprofundaceae bacterium]|nr:hypothetical protein [Mariprofundaceae bacterium]